MGELWNKSAMDTEGWSYIKIFKLKPIPRADPVPHGWGLGQERNERPHSIYLKIIAETNKLVSYFDRYTFIMTIKSSEHIRRFWFRESGPNQYRCPVFPPSDIMIWSWSQPNSGHISTLFWSLLEPMTPHQLYSLPSEGKIRGIRPHQSRKQWLWQGIQGLGTLSMF